MSASAYPKYRRRNNGFQINKKGNVFDNCDVVPYNPMLSKKYNCHLNVEIVSSIRAVKYLYKYSYKGHDRAEMEITHDEVQEHLDGRYVGPCEAAWRLFEFSMAGKSHSVQRLALHLENQQSVLFNPDPPEEALHNCKDTTLTAWFKLNEVDADANSILYSDIPKYYTWNNRDKKWQKRSDKARAACNTIGRIYAASPREQERYYLYLLLLRVPGAKSFNDLKKVPGEDVSKSTFREACDARGLIDNDDEYALTLRDALETKSANQCRRFLAHLLANVEISDALAIWERHKLELVDDYMHMHNDIEVALGLGLQNLQDILEPMGIKLSSHNLPMPPNFDEELFRNKELRRETASYDMSYEARCYEENVKTMRPDQSALFHAVKKAIDAGTGNIFFADGPGGSGKTYVEKTLLHYVRSQKKIALACAWSGVAATLLEGGRTCHSIFGFPVPLPADNVPCKISAQDGRAKVLKAASLIIWDEISMSPCQAVDAADYMLRDFMQLSLIHI